MKISMGICMVGMFVAQIVRDPYVVAVVGALLFANGFIFIVDAIKEKN